MYRKTNMDLKPEIHKSNENPKVLYINFIIKIHHIGRPLTII